MPRLGPRRLIMAACLVIPILSIRDVTGQDAQAGSHVRTEDASLARVIREGLEQSATFRHLVERLDRASGLVYVMSSRCLTRAWEPRACLDHQIRVSEGFRFLRVNVHPSESGATLLALIAHELQHALEVLSDDTITTFDDVERLYQRIGTKQRSGNIETEAALRMQDIVLREARETRGARQSIRPRRVRKRRPRADLRELAYRCRWRTASPQESQPSDGAE